MRKRARDKNTMHEYVGTAYVVLCFVDSARTVGTANPTSVCARSRVGTTHGSHRRKGVNSTSGAFVAYLRKTEEFLHF